MTATVAALSRSEFKQAWKLKPNSIHVTVHPVSRPGSQNKDWKRGIDEFLICTNKVWTVSP